MTPRMVGYGFCGLAMVTVGSTVVASKLIAAGIPPFTAAALRFAIAFPILALLMVATRTPWPRPDRRDGVILLIQAASGSVGYTVLLIVGTGLSTAVAAGAITGSLPAVAAAIAVLVLGERLDRVLAGSIALAAVGVLLVSVPFGAAGVDLAPRMLLGNALVFGAVVCEALFILLNRKLRTPIAPLPLSASMTGIGLALALVPALLERPWITPLETLPLLGVLYYALVPTVLGFLLWYAGSQRVRGGEASLLTALAPVSAVVLSAVVLRESVEPNQLLGTACVLGAVALTALRRRTPRRRLRRWILRSAIAAAVLVLAATGVTLAAGARARATLAAEHPAPGRLVDVGGFEMHLHCTGQGAPTVVLEAGLLDFSVQWSRVQPEVARFTRVCSYDRAGLGWSEAGPEPRTSEVMVQELRTLLTHAGIGGPYVLVGHSFGGANVRLFAHRFPGDVAGMVLVDASHEEQTLRVPALLDAAEVARAEFRSLAPLSTLGLMALRPEDIPDRNLPAEALDRYRAVLATSDYFRAALAEIEGMEESFAEIRAAGITDLGDRPLVVLSRGKDEPTPGIPEHDRPAYERLWQDMQSELVTMSRDGLRIIAEESGHYIQLEQPELVVDALERTILALR